MGHPLPGGAAPEGTGRSPCGLGPHRAHGWESSRSGRSGDAVSRMQWGFGQENTLEVPGQVLQHVCTQQLLSFGGGLTFGHRELGRRSARARVSHARCERVSAESFAGARGGSLGRRTARGHVELRR